MSSSLFLLFLVMLSPLCLARDLPDSPSPSPVLADQPEFPSPSQAPQMSGYSIEPPPSSPSQAPQAHHQEPKYPFEPPSPSQAPQSNLEPENPLEPPSPSQAPQAHLEPGHLFEPPSPSQAPSQAPRAHLEPGYLFEPRIPSPSPAPQIPQYPKNKPPPPSPSHDHHHHRGHHHGHHHHHKDQPPRQILPPGLGSTPILQCWAPTLNVTGCVDDIKMAYHEVKYDIAPKCCHAINKTSDECLFNMLYYRAHNRFFILWLREHCSHLDSV